MARAVNGVRRLAAEFEFTPHGFVQRWLTHTHADDWEPLITDVRHTVSSELFRDISRSHPRR